MVDSVIINIALPNIFPVLLLPEGFHQRLLLAAVSINGLIYFTVTHKQVNPFIPSIPRYPLNLQQNPSQKLKRKMVKLPTNDLNINNNDNHPNIPKVFLSLSACVSYHQGADTVVQKCYNDTSHCHSCSVSFHLFAPMYPCDQYG